RPAVASPSRLTGGASPLARAADHAAGPPAGEAARGRTPSRQEAQAASPVHAGVSASPKTAGAGIGASPKAGPAHHFHMEPTRSSSSATEAAVEGLSQGVQDAVQLLEGCLEARPDDGRVAETTGAGSKAQGVLGARQRPGAFGRRGQGRRCVLRLRPLRDAAASPGRPEFGCMPDFAADRAG
ncbi:unnamed protein product, partial [Prorocentrum cordatum]